MTSPATPPNRFRTIAAWVIATVSLMLTVLFAGLLARDASFAPAWFGVICFGLAFLGAITTIELDRRSRRNQ